MKLSSSEAVTEKIFPKYTCITIRPGERGVPYTLGVRVGARPRPGQINMKRKGKRVAKAPGEKKKLV